MTTATCISPRLNRGSAHERAVAEFLASCEPARLRALDLLWPVLSERQMQRRQYHEIPVGDHHDIEIVASRVGRARRLWRVDLSPLPSAR